MKRRNAASQELEQIEYSSHRGAAVFPICMKVMSEYLEEDREVLQRAVSVLGRWVERFYAKDIQAYDAWREMLLEESLNVLVQKDVVEGLIDDRNQEAKYLLELAAGQGEGAGTQLEQAARHFQKVSAYAKEILYLIGDWPDMDAMLRHLSDRKVREELAELILYAKGEDEAALQCIKAYLC